MEHVRNAVGVPVAVWAAKAGFGDHDDIVKYYTRLVHYLIVDSLLLAFCVSVSPKYRLTSLAHHAVAGTAVSSWRRSYFETPTKRITQKLRMYAVQEAVAQLLTVQYYLERYGGWSWPMFLISWMYVASRIVLPLAIRAVGRDQYGFAEYTNEMVCANVFEMILFALNCAWSYAMLQRTFFPSGKRKSYA